MIRKGRARMFGAARLTEADVADIKRRLADGQSTASVARLKSASYGSVFDIKTNRSWRHVKAAVRVDGGDSAITSSHAEGRHHPARDSASG